jgi:hypothetical protein
MVRISVSRAARTRMNVVEPSLPGEPHEWKVIARVESRVRRRHSAVEEEFRDVVDQLSEGALVATADAHDVQLDAAHAVQAVGVQPRVAVVVEHGMDAEEARRRGRDGRGRRVPQPVAGPRVKRIYVDHRNRFGGKRREQPELDVQRLEYVAPELAADGHEELAPEGFVERASASARELEIRRQRLCEAHLDVEPARAVRLLEHRADAASARVLCQSHREAGARQVALELLKARREFVYGEQCNQLRRGTANDSVHAFLDDRGRSPTVISSLATGSDMNIGRPASIRSPSVLAFVVFAPAVRCGELNRLNDGCASQLPPSQRRGSFGAGGMAARFARDAELRVPAIAGTLRRNVRPR